MITTLNTQQKSLLLFVTRLIIFYGIWKLFYYITWHDETLLASYRAFSLDVINVILAHTSYLLELLSFQTETVAENRLVRIIGTVGVTVGEPCIGYGIITFFIALIISYPGSWQKKIWFIPLGVSLIYFANLTRISLLAMSVQYDYALWELNHKFIFKIIVYGIIMLLWMQWIKLSKRQPSYKLVHPVIA